MGAIIARASFASVSAGSFNTFTGIFAAIRVSTPAVSLVAAFSCALLVLSVRVIPTG